MNDRPIPAAAYSEGRLRCPDCDRRFSDPDLGLAYEAYAQHWAEQHGKRPPTCEHIIPEYASPAAYYNMQQVSDRLCGLPLVPDGASRCRECGRDRYGHQDHRHADVNINGRCQFGCCGTYTASRLTCSAGHGTAAP